MFVSGILIALSKFPIAFTHTYVHKQFHFCN